MRRALLWKEWRQLSLIRWFLLAVSVAVVPVLPWLISRGEGYTYGELLLDLVPLVLALGFWPVTALFLAVQALGQDRAAGTEAFLRELPVGFRAVVSARWLAAAGSFLLVALASAIVFYLLAPAAGYAPQSLPDLTLFHFCIGLFLSAVALVAGGVGATLVAPAFPAVILGLVLVTGTGFAGWILASRTHHATWSQLGSYGPVGPVLGSSGYALSWALLAACFLAPWVAFGMGEPSGRGRWKRLALLGIGAVVLGACLFVGLAAWSVEAAVRAGVHFSWQMDETRFLSPDGSRLWVRGWSHQTWEDGGWLVDVDSGRPVEFFPPPAGFLGWSPEGDRLVVASGAGPLGSERDPVLLVLDAGSGEERRRLDLGPRQGFRFYDGFWLDSGLWMIEGSSEERSLVLTRLDLASGRGEVMARGAGGRPICCEGLLEREGTIFVVAGSEWKDRSLHRLEPEAPGGLSAPLARGRGNPSSFDHRLSPSGRYTIVPPEGSARSGGRPHRILDLSTGLEQGMGGVREATSQHYDFRHGDEVVWLQEDRLVWQERTGESVVVRVARPGREPRNAADLEARTRLRAEPGGDRLLSLDSTGARLRVHLIDVGADRVETLEPPEGTFPVWLGRGVVGWLPLAAPRDGRFLAVQRIDGKGGPVWIDLD